MGKDKKNKKSKKKGRKDSDSSTPQSSVPSVDDETQQLLQRGAHGTSQARKSKSPQKSTSLAESSILRKTKYEYLAETPSTAPLSHPVPGVSHLDVPGSECGATKPRSPPKISIFSQIKNKLSPKKKSPNKLDSQCKCENKRNHMPECPEWNKFTTDAEHNSPLRPSDTNPSVFVENAQSSNSSNPITEGSDNVQLQRTSRHNRLSVPSISAVTLGPPRRRSLSRVKISPGKKTGTIFPVSDCNCADKCNHDKGCPEKSQEIEVRLEDAEISISSASNASPTILKENEDGDVNNASSSAEFKVKERERTTENYFEDRSTLNSPLEKSREEIQETLTDSYSNLSRDLQRYRAIGYRLGMFDEALSTEIKLKRLDEYCVEDQQTIIKNKKLQRKRSRSVTAYTYDPKLPFKPQPKVKNDDDNDDLEVEGATGWSDTSTAKNKKLLRQDAIDVHDQSDTEPHRTDQYDERRRQRAQLTATPERSVPFIEQTDPQIQSDRDAQLGAAAASSVGSNIPSSQLGARPKIRNAVKKDVRDVDCPQSTATGSNPSVIHSKLEACQSHESGQSSKERCRADPSVIPLKPMVCRSPASAQPRTTPPRTTDPSRIQSKPEICRSPASAQPRTPPRTDPFRIQSKPEICRSPASAQPRTPPRTTDPSRIQSKPEICRSPASAPPHTKPPRSDPFRIQSKPEIGRSPASAQPYTTPPRTHQSRIQSKPEICRSPAMGQSRTTPPRTDPSTIQSDQTIDASDANGQRIDATGKEESLPELTEDDVQSLSGATGISESLRRHQSAPPRGPPVFGPCECGRGYLHAVGCSRVIRARRRRTERRCKQEVEILDYLYKKWEKEG